MVIQNSSLDFQGTCHSVERDLCVPELTPSNTHRGMAVAGAREAKGIPGASPGHNRSPDLGKRSDHRGGSSLGRWEAVGLCEGCHGSPRSSDRTTESQNGRGWKGPLWVI